MNAYELVQLRSHEVIRTFHGTSSIRNVCAVSQPCANVYLLIVIWFRLVLDRLFQVCRLCERAKGKTLGSWAAFQRCDYSRLDHIEFLISLLPQLLRMKQTWQRTLYYSERSLLCAELDGVDVELGACCPLKKGYRQHLSIADVEVLILFKACLGKLRNLTNHGQSSKFTWTDRLMEENQRNACLLFELCNIACKRLSHVKCLCCFVLLCAAFSKMKWGCPHAQLSRQLTDHISLQWTLSYPPSLFLIQPPEHVLRAMQEWVRDWGATGRLSSITRLRWARSKMWPVMSHHSESQSSIRILRGREVISDRCYCVNVSIFQSVIAKTKYLWNSRTHVRRCVRAPNAPCCVRFQYKEMWKWSPVFGVLFRKGAIFMTTAFLLIVQVFVPDNGTVRARGIVLPR